MKLVACSMQDGSILVENSEGAWNTVGLAHRQAQRLVEAGLLHSGREYMLGGFSAGTTIVRFMTKRIKITSPATRKIWGGMLFQMTLAGIELANTQLPPMNLDYVRCLLDSFVAYGFAIEVTDIVEP